MMKICKDYKIMFENIIRETSDYMTIHHMKAMIIGISGGIDSALCAAIAHEAKKRITHEISIIGVSIPIQSEGIEVERSRLVGEAFCDHFRLDGIASIYYPLKGDLVATAKKYKIRCGNIKARLRMIKLFDIANENDGLVISTDNYTEYLLGFWTLHGDVGNFGPIQNLWKTEVYGLTDYLFKGYKEQGKLKKSEALYETINAIPTDGLGITDSDFDQIYPEYNRSLRPSEVYEKIDEMLMNYNPVASLNNVTRRYINSSFKRYDPYNIPRELITGEQL